jgi:septal ring factor EnvC (AmiA/AmiB activator)
MNYILQLRKQIEAKDVEIRDYQSQRDSLQAEIARRKETMKKMQSDFEAQEKVSNKQKAELQAHIDKMVLRAFSTEDASGDATTWEDALKECGGEYSKAAKKYPELVAAYNRDHQSKKSNRE